ncbi:MAG TPA: tetratricopeptide repeat protein [Blastocatellia bacterium]|nr:tetratricopeptide repeat protein [Blastocatellia bacterium]
MRSPLLILILILFTSSLSAAQSHHATAPKDKQTAAQAYEEGQNAHERGDLTSAIKHYTSAINADPSLFQAYYQRAVALLALNRDGDAAADLKRVVEIEPRFARAHRALGKLLLDRGETEDAKRELALAIELEPKITETRIYYASALIKTGEPAKAAEQLLAGIDQGEAGALTYALLGVATERTGKIDEALKHYARAIELDPANATAREGRARYFESKNDLAKAVEEYSVAYQSQPSRELALKLCDLHARAGQPQAAIQFYRRLIAESPEDISLRVELARLMAENGQVEEAITDINRLLAAQPNNAKLLIFVADLSLKNKPELAVDYYRKAVDADPKDTRARVQLGAALVRSMQYDAALPVLTDVIAREKDNYPAHANLATALFKLLRYPEAAREFIWIIGKRPEVAASYYFLAISFDKIHDCEQALRAYKEFVQRADPAANRNEIEEANTRLAFLQRQAKEGKCKSLARGNKK